MSLALAVSACASSPSQPYYASPQPYYASPQPYASSDAPHEMTVEEIMAIPTSFPTTIVPPRSERFAAFIPMLEQRKPTERAGNVVSWFFRVRELSVPIRIEECGPGHSAMYQPSNNSITLCYEFIERINKAAGKAGNALYQIDPTTYDVLIFTTLHEIGHALIPNLQLRLSGNEEVLADQFAFLVMGNLGDDTALMRVLVQSTSAFFEAESETYAHDPSDPHPSDVDRAFEAKCLLFGRTRLPEIGGQLGDRAPACVERAARITATWNEALGRFARASSGRPF